MTATHDRERTRTRQAAPGALFGRSIGWLYLVGGGIGFLASFILSVEEYLSLLNPDYVASCSLNPVVSCGSVMESDQATLFGFPNPLIGVAAFAVVVTAGVGLLSGFEPPRWFWLGMQLGTTLGLVFVHWLMIESLYDIGALCPYCMVVWAVTIAAFWYTTLHNVDQGHLPAGAARAPLLKLARVHTVVVVAWYLVIVALILHAFWSFWITLV